ncbi:MAG: mandelate racemase, partial [Chloroflexi bacterium]|nr:mandelate racemase [Chloroflexota bacterium]
MIRFLLMPPFPTGEQWAIEDYAKHALGCKERGFTAYKLHIFNPIEEHMAICRAVREAVGNDMVLIYDPVGIYEPDTALKAGRELEKLGFHWFEEPIQDYHMESLIKLCHQLDIPIATMEVLPGNIYSRAQYIVKGAVDIVRSDTLFNGGITSLKKTASLAEAFGMNCEIHYNPNPLANAANLHVMCSIKNSEYYEWAVPEWIWTFGTKKNIVL